MKSKAFFTSRELFLCDGVFDIRCLVFALCLPFPIFLSILVSTFFLAVWCPAWLMTEAQQTNPRDGWSTIWYRQPTLHVHIYNQHPFFQHQQHNHNTDAPLGSANQGFLWPQEPKFGLPPEERSRLLDEENFSLSLYLMTILLNVLWGLIYYFVWKDTGLRNQVR